MQNYLPIAVDRHRDEQQHRKDNRWDDDVEWNLGLLLVAHGAHVEHSMAKLNLRRKKRGRERAET